MLSGFSFTQIYFNYLGSTNSSSSSSAAGADNDDDDSNNIIIIMNIYEAHKSKNTCENTHIYQ